MAQKDYENLMSASQKSRATNAESITEKESTWRRWPRRTTRTSCPLRRRAARRTPRASRRRRARGGDGPEGLREPHVRFAEEPRDERREHHGEGEHVEEMAQKDYENLMSASQKSRATNAESITE